MSFSEDTIAAVSTGMNNSGIGIVRVSGSEAIEIVNKIFRPLGRVKSLDEAKSHTIHYGNIVDGSRVVDEVLVMLMRGPHTYTREDTVEVDCHGGMLVLKEVLELIVRTGARLAEPGEFTKRAFLNGRIDLSQAEAVIDVINAENDYALRSAESQLKGAVSGKIRKIRASLLEKIAYIEAALDDPEHIELDGFGDILTGEVKNCLRDVNALVDSAEDGRIIKEGVKTVILGKPNVGKSSLLNVLVGHDRAIVTEIAGTTRDALEESIKLKNITLNVIDTAGIRNTEDRIEKIGVEKSVAYAGEADLIVWVIDSTRDFEKEDFEILELIKNKRAVVLLNKLDVKGELTVEDVRKMLKKGLFGCETGIFEGDTAENTGAGNGCWVFGEPPVIGISTKTQEGIEELTETVCHMFYNKEIDFNDQVYITNMRQKQALISAKESLERALESVNAGVSEDFYTIDLMDAYKSLGEVIGESLEDDLADEIFSKFCMGK